MFSFLPIIVFRGIERVLLGKTVGFKNTVTMGPKTPIGLPNPGSITMFTRVIKGHSNLRYPALSDFYPNFAF